MGHDERQRLLASSEAEPEEVKALALCDIASAMESIAFAIESLVAAIDDRESSRV